MLKLKKVSEKHIKNGEVTKFYVSDHWISNAAWIIPKALVDELQLELVLRKMEERGRLIRIEQKEEAFQGIIDNCSGEEPFYLSSWSYESYYRDGSKAMDLQLYVNESFTKAVLFNKDYIDFFGRPAVLYGADVEEPFRDDTSVISVIVMPVDAPKAPGESFEIYSLFPSLFRHEEEKGLSRRKKRRRIKKG